MHLFIIFFLLFPASFLGMDTPSNSLAEIVHSRNKSLVQMAAEGNLTGVRFLCRIGASPNFIDEEIGESALLAAIENNHEKVVQYFLNETDCDVSKRVWSNYPMEKALEIGNTKIIQLLSLKKPFIRSASTQIIKAVNQKNIAGLQYLVGKTNADVNLRGEKDKTALHIASQQGDLNTVVSLLKKGAQVDAEDAFGITPLFYAAKHTAIAHALITEHANIHHRTSNLSSYQTPLFPAVIEKNYDLADLLLSRGASCNCFDSKGYTPLHYAIEGKDEKMVSLLLKYHANPNLKTTQSTTTPLGMAVQNQSSKMLDIFIENKSSINETDFQGLTPLAHARIKGDYITFMVLLKNGAYLKTAKKIDFKMLATQVTLNPEIEKMLNPTFFQKWFGNESLGFRVATFFAAIKNKVTKSWNYHPFAQWYNNKRSV